MRVTPEEVRRVAALARIRVEEEEAEALAGQLADILAHVDELDDAPVGTAPAGDADVDVDGDVPETADGSSSELRADAPGVDALDRDLASLAPGWKDGFFTVPRLRSHREAGALDEEEP